MNYFILFLATVFYIQNLAISFFINFTFEPNLIEFMMILFILLIISKLKYQKPILYIWQLFYLIHFCFISYFGTTLTYVDIYLFFTHISETFATFFSVLSMMVIPIINFIFIAYLIHKIELKKSNIHSIIPTAFLLASIYTLPKINDASFLLIQESIKVFTIDTKQEIKQNDKAIQAISSKDINIVLVIGESMRAKEYLHDSYSFFENNQYKTIYSGATNTDVSIPLLINGAKRPKEINLSHNLFALANDNNFTTHFISTQNQQYLKYIKPYLAHEKIRNYKVLESQDDIDLFKELQAIDFSKNNFIVMQMQGQHSPYNFYPNAKNETIQTHYTNSMQYSNEILNKLHQYISSKSKKPYIFLFTSDHGELIGDNNKFGHNRFEEKIYKVPFIYVSNIPLDTSNIINHNDIYNIIKHHLGYTKTFKPNQFPITIYGTMINEEDGFIEISK